DTGHSARCRTGRVQSSLATISQAVYRELSFRGASWLTSVVLFLHLEFHLGDTAVDHAELFGGGMRDVDHAPGDERAAVVDPEGDGLRGGDVGNAQTSPERQRAVRGGQLAGIELLPARGLRFILVEARDPDRAIREGRQFG